MTLIRSIFWFLMILVLLTLGIYVAGLILLVVPFVVLFLCIYYWIKLSKD